MIQQVEITLKPKSRGFHLVTGELSNSAVKVGTIYPCRDGLWQVLTARHPCQFPITDKGLKILSVIHSRQSSFKQLMSQESTGSCQRI